MKHILSIGILCLLAACSPKENQKTFVYEGNPLVRNNFTADPAALVHGDRLYLYVGHDEYYADKIRLREAGVQYYRMAVLLDD